jgi:serine/threonine protein phosphatase PrpC
MTLLGTGTQIAWGERTDIGRTRRTNQDAVLAKPPIFVVADGMGGHAAGEVASQLAVATFASLAENEVLLRDLVRVTRQANDEILADVDRHPDRAGMGTTVSGLAIAEGRNGTYAAVINVGDSRTYLLRNRAIVQITTDHSVVQELLDAGDISHDEAAVHPHRHVVTRVLGADDDVEVDATIVPVLSGDRFLICSDGLCGVVPLDQVEAALRHDDSPQQIADLLVEIALEHGGPDNVSVIVVEVTTAVVPDTLFDDDIGDLDTIPGAQLPAR